MDSSENILVSRNSIRILIANAETLKLKNIVHRTFNKKSFSSFSLSLGYRLSLNVLSRSLSYPKKKYEKNSYFGRKLKIVEKPNDVVRSNTAYHLYYHKVIHTDEMGRLVAFPQKRTKKNHNSIFNQAERGNQCLKTKWVASIHFPVLEGEKYHVRIHSPTPTLRKNSLRAFPNLTNTFDGLTVLF